MSPEQPQVVIERAELDDAAALHEIERNARFMEETGIPGAADDEDDDEQAA